MKAPATKRNHATPSSFKGRKRPDSIDDTTREESLARMREVFGDGAPRDRETALRELARAFGWERTGYRIRDTLDADLRTAVRRGILQNEAGQLSLHCRRIEEYDRDFLKEQFLAALGTTWHNRDEAIRLAARYLGFRRAGPIITDTFRSLINGLLREQRLERNGSAIRRA